MKPIVQGCLAMIIKSWAGNEGKVVKVGKYMGFNPEDLSVNDYWEVEGELNAVYINFLGNKVGNTKCSAVQESCMIRVDGYEKEAEGQIKHDVLSPAG